MSKKASSTSKGPALRQRRSGDRSSSTAEGSCKRASPSSKKTNQHTGSRQPKQPPRKLAIGNCANCGCTQAETCLWRTHPTPDGEGGKVKLCNACGIHIRDKGFNRRVTEEMRRRQSTHAKATRLSWAALNGHKSDSDIEDFGTPPPSSPTSSAFSDDEAPPSPALTKASTPSPSQPPPASPRKNSLRASPKASPKSKFTERRKPCNASKANRPAPLKLTKSHTTSVKVAQLHSPTSPSLKKKEVAIRPKPSAQEPEEELMSDEDAATILCDLVGAAWRYHDGFNGSGSACSSDGEGSQRSQLSLNYTAQALPCITSYHGAGYYPTPGPEQSFHNFSSHQSSPSSWTDASSSVPFDRRDSVESVQIMTPPVTPTLSNNSSCGPQLHGKGFQQPPVVPHVEPASDLLFFSR